MRDAQISTEYQFTRDWFRSAPEVWGHIREILPGKLRFLEIGAYEGRSTVWTLEHMLDDMGEITVIDTWEGSDEHKIGGDDMQSVEGRFLYNIALAREKYPRRYVDVCKGESSQILRRMADKQFDFIYIDGSHRAKDVMTDACMVWPLLCKGGVLVFDDYMWGNPSDVLNRPKLAIDMFTTLFGEELNFIHTGYQLAVQRK